MSDLTDQLRSYRSTSEWGDGVRHEICDKAAEEIERLRGLPAQGAMRLERQIPLSGQAHRAARDDALADFADEMVRAGLIRETYRDGTLVLEVARDSDTHR